MEKIVLKNCKNKYLNLFVDNFELKIMSLRIQHQNAGVQTVAPQLLGCRRPKEPSYLLAVSYPEIDKKNLFFKAQSLLKIILFYLSKLFVD